MVWTKFNVQQNQLAAQRTEMYKNIWARRIFVCHSRQHTNLKETVIIGEIFTSLICSNMLQIISSIYCKYHASFKMCVQVISVTSYFFLPFHYSSDTEFPLSFYLFHTSWRKYLHRLRLTLLYVFSPFVMSLTIVQIGLMFRKQRWEWSLHCIRVRQLTIILSSLMKWLDGPLYSVGYTRTEGCIRSRL